MIDLNELRQAIRKLNRQQPLYRVLRDELTLIDHWKQKKRGKPNTRFSKELH